MPKYVLPEKQRFLMGERAGESRAIRLSATPRDREDAFQVTGELWICMVCVMLEL
jgi:hypothetical protein